MTQVLTPKMCSDTYLSPEVCYASGAGVYTSSSSTTAIGEFAQVNLSDSLAPPRGGLDVLPGPVDAVLDQMRIGPAMATPNTLESLIVPNISLILHDKVGVQYPDGSIHALQVGTLGLGYLGNITQVFPADDARDGTPANATQIPSYLQTLKLTSSNSFGLHVGLVEPKIPGSLLFGGYDSNRIYGEISSQWGPVADVDEDTTIDLIDIGMSVVEGLSPWNVSSVGGLLAAGNSSLGATLGVRMQPEAPYLNLPKSTCDAISAWLPVTYRPDLGLYTWNTKDPQYSRIVSSPSVLSFVFRKDLIDVHNLTINVPFALLNLTLQAPLTKDPTPYFPCNAQSRGVYSLGRSFLQAAFLGANWNAMDNIGVWWLAQAPGPNIPKEDNRRTIRDQDITIYASNNEWKDTWKGFWTPLTPSVVGNEPTESSPSSSSVDEHSPPDYVETGLSTGQAVGIAVGSALFGVLALSLCAYFIRRRWRRTHNDANPIPQTDPTGIGELSGLASPSYKPVNGGYGPVEMNHDPINPVYELMAEPHRD